MDDMAVSGRNVSGFQTPAGSAQKVHKHCDPCQDDGHRVEAHGLCVDCQEYLCSNCFSCHRKTKASKHHVLLEKDQMDKGKVAIKSPDCSTDKCSAHKNEVIKFFCPKHGALGCHDCIVLDHRTCDVDYIPDKCEDIGNSREYTETMKRVEQQLTKTEVVIKKGEAKDKEIDISHGATSKAIALFRKEMNERIDALQLHADKKKSQEKQKIQTLLASCTDMTSNLKRLKSDMADGKKKNQDVQLFIALKHAEAELKIKEIKTAEVEESIDQSSTNSMFERNEDLQKMMSGQNVFGTITDNSAASFTTRKQNVTFTSLMLHDKEDIRVKTSTDAKSCSITACELLSPDKLVLADATNTKLKLVDLNKHVVTEETKLGSSPRDITLLPNDELAVTLHDKKEIVVLTTSGGLCINRRIKVKGLCRGIFYHQHHMYVVYQAPNCLLVIDTQSNNQKTVMLTDTNYFYAPNYIVPQQDFRQFYISNFSSNTVVSVTSDGEICGVYKDKELVKPLGMAMLDDGSLLVVCFRNNAVHHISGDLKQGRKLAFLSQNLISVCYNSGRREVYIGSVAYDKLKVLTLSSR